MKKLLVVALSVVFVLAFAALAMAENTTSFVGNVNAEYNTNDAINNNYGDVWAEFSMQTSFNDSWTGGLKFRVKPKDSNTGMEGDGFIKYAAEMWNVNFATGGGFSAGLDLNPANATKDIKIPNPLDDPLVTGDEFVTAKVYEGSIAGSPSITFNLTPFEGFTGTLFLNEEGAATKQAYNYGLKAVYDLSPLKVGVGYTTEALGTSDSADDISAMGVFGSYKLLEDALAVGAEYQSRTFGTDDTDPQVGMKVYANYSKGALSAGVSYITRTVAFNTKDDKGYEDLSAPAPENFNLADRFMDLLPGWNDPITGTETHNLISFNVSYKVTDAITVGANVDTTDTSFDGSKADGTDVTDVSMGYKVYVSDQIAPNLKVEGGYQSFIDSKVYVTLSATL